MNEQSPKPYELSSLYDAQIKKDRYDAQITLIKMMIHWFQHRDDTHISAVLEALPARHPYQHKIYIEVAKCMEHGIVDPARIWDEIEKIHATRQDTDWQEAYALEKWHIATHPATDERSDAEQLARVHAANVQALNRKTQQN